MLKLTLLITPHLDVAHQIGVAWQKAGAPGVTFIEGHGLYRLQQASKAYNVLPGMLSLMEILRQQEENNIIILSVVPQVLVDKLIDEAEHYIGDIHQPGNGIMFILDVERALGIRNITDFDEQG